MGHNDCESQWVAHSPLVWPQWVTPLLQRSWRKPQWWTDQPQRQTYLQDHERTEPAGTAAPAHGQTQFRLTDRPFDETYFHWAHSPPQYSLGQILDYQCPSPTLSYWRAERHVTVIGSCIQHNQWNNSFFGHLALGVRLTGTSSWGTVLSSIVIRFCTIVYPVMLCSTYSLKQVR